MAKKEKWTPQRVVRHADSLRIYWSILLPEHNLRAPGWVRSTDGHRTVLDIVASDKFPRRRPYTDSSAGRALGLSDAEVLEIQKAQDGVAGCNTELRRAIEHLIVSPVPRGKLQPIQQVKPSAISIPRGSPLPSPVVQMEVEDSDDD